jgi:putative hydrolase of the HAD superfamily
VPVPRDLPVKRRDVTGRPTLAPQAITLDFGNTLVPVDGAALRSVVEATARHVSERLGPFDLSAYLVAWQEERDRQFREEVPRFREVDLADRFVRLLARFRGMPPPAPEAPWDQVAAARLSHPAEIDWAVAAYGDAFVRLVPPPPSVGPLLERLARDRPVAILSNWPHAAVVDRYIEVAGWVRHLAAVVVSQRVGAIKPHPAIFAATRRALGEPTPESILHVGDDWAADVVGAANAGWRTAYLRNRPGDSPLPSSERDGTVVPDLELDELTDLPDVLAPGRAAGRR